MNSGWYILAKECEAFEAELAAYVGTKEAVLCSSWTTGALMLHHAMGVCSGDEILVPKPSYPLFEFLADLSDVKLVPYPLIYDHGWQIDLDSLYRATTERTRAVILVHPNGIATLYIAVDGWRL